MDMIRNHKHYAKHIFMGLVYKTKHFTDSSILLKYYGQKGEMYMGDIKDVLEIISKINIPWYLKAGIAVIIIILLVIGLLLKGYRQCKDTARKNSNEIKQDWNNLSTKDKIVKVIIIIAVLIIFIISMFLFFYKIEDNNEKSSVENSSQNNSIYTQITISDKKGKIINPIGVDIIKSLNIDGIIYFTYNYCDTVNDKKIYYPVLYKWKKGQSAERISEGACPHFEVVKDSVVYLNSTTDVISHGELYVSRPDGINKRVLDDEIWDFVIDQDYIYYQYCYDTVGAGLGGHALHRMDVNGANSTVVAYEVNSPYLKSDYHNFKIKDGWAIYKNYKIELQDQATGLEKVVMTDKTDIDWLYYTTNQLIKAKPDGTSQIILDEEDSFWYQIDKIDGKWIYYQKGKDKYKIDEDGNNKSLLEKG